MSEGRIVIPGIDKEVSRRDVIKVGGAAGLGLAFSKPLMNTIKPLRAFGSGGYGYPVGRYYIFQDVAQNTWSANTVWDKMWNNSTFPFGICLPCSDGHTFRCPLVVRIGHDTTKTASDAGYWQFDVRCCEWKAQTNCPSCSSSDYAPGQDPHDSGGLALICPGIQDRVFGTGSTPTPLATVYSGLSIASGDQPTALLSTICP